ncbi:hypothetical protein C5B94_12240 [Clavibacter michiganensis]|nr:hypothetical protein C5B94_12240 [Clavibacter michiganensis]
MSIATSRGSWRAASTAATSIPVSPAMSVGVSSSVHVSVSRIDRNRMSSSTPEPAVRRATSPLTRTVSSDVRSPARAVMPDPSSTDSLVSRRSSVLEMPVAADSEPMVIRPSATTRRSSLIVSSESVLT